MITLGPLGSEGRGSDPLLQGGLLRGPLFLTFAGARDPILVNPRAGSASKI